MTPNLIYTCDLKFVSHTPLTKAMLEEMYGLTKDYIEILYSEYPNGIVKGLDIIYKDKDIFLSPGLVKLENKIFRLAEEFNLSLFIRKELECGKIKSQNPYRLMFKQSMEEKAKLQYYTLDLECINPNNISEQGIQFADFILDSNAELAISGINYENSKWDTNGLWTMCHCCYAGRTGNTYHPWVFKHIADIIESNTNLDCLECSMLQEIYCTGIIEKKLLDLYLKKYYEKQGKNKKEFNSNGKEYLLLLLKALRCEGIHQVQPNHSRKPISNHGGSI